MKQYQLVLLTITFILIIYVLMRFFKRRNEVNHLRNKLHIEGLKNKPRCKNASCMNNDIDKIEGFGSPESEYSGLVESTPTSIMSIGKEYTNRPLKEYVIKSSYNSAITGKYVNPEMVKYLLQRGCRLLDFEVLYIDEMPYVTYTTDSNLEAINTDNKVLLDNILTSAVSQAFTQPSPNYEDPLFIHLRLKSKQNDIYKAVAKSIDATLRGKLYSKKITDTTKLSDIMGKVVIIMDKTINRKYETDSICKVTDKDCYKLPKYINMDSGSDLLYQNTYTDILNQPYNIVNVIDKCDHCTNVRHNRMVVPEKTHSNTNNPNALDLIGKHGCQIVTQRFYLKDDNLYKYEKLFDDNKGGVIPLAFAFDYIQKQS